MKIRIAAVVSGVLALALFAGTQDLHLLASNLPWEMERVVLGLTLWQWLVGAAIVLAGMLIGFAANVICGWIFAMRAAHEGSSGARRGVRRSIGLLAGAAFWLEALPGLELPARIDEHALQAVHLLIVVASIWLVYSLWDELCDAMTAKAAAMNRRAEKLLVPVTRKLVRFLIVLGGGMVALGWMGANVAGLLAGLGIGGLAVALAAKDSVENVFGSLTILFDMPFAIGDWVRIGPVDGIVEEINLRSTRIRTFQDSMITLPNSNLIKASVENFGARRFRQMRLKLVVPFDTPAEALDEYCRDLRAAIVDRPHTRSEQVHVYLNDLADTGIAILIECFIEAETYERELSEREAVLRETARLAHAHGVHASGSPPPPV